MPSWMALSFQDCASPAMEHLMFFHDHTMLVLIFILTSIFYVITSSLTSNTFDKYFNDHQPMEFAWSTIPVSFLVFIAMPSMKALYIMDDMKDPVMTIKTTGHQWYWSYEYTSINMMETENFMAPSSTIRLLKTSELLYLPVNTVIRNIITSMDVIHSWAIPSLGVKMDAFPGRINQNFLFSKRIGLFAGQCSEICGVNHSFMPILALITTPKEFLKKMESL